MQPLKKFYFSEYEDRVPEPPLPHDKKLEFLWQCLLTTAIFLGAWYLWWRWTYSINWDAVWFSIPVACAETCAFIGLILFSHNIWSVNDVAPKSPPVSRKEAHVGPDRGTISVDVFLPTYTEDPELTRYSIRDAKALKYPVPLDLKIHVLDDGNRPEMQRVAKQEGVNYITRSTNLGYKAGNLRNGMEQTTGDFLVILDSDTRPFPSLLTNTLGYFRDPDVAWVQTPQWFYDLPEGHKVSDVLARRFGKYGKLTGSLVERIIGPVKIGHDPFISDPKLFYDVIQRRRNGANASFCCGAGSIHRRNAVIGSAIRMFSKNIEAQAHDYTAKIHKAETRKIRKALFQELGYGTEITPYKFHVSEDIYTSIVIQSEENRNWKSVLHPGVETKMLSPLDMQSWAMQRFKYAGGTLDILINDNPLFRSGLSFRQKLMYAATFWSYLSPIWNVVFLSAPIIALLTGVSPIIAYSSEFFLHLLPFLIFHELAAMASTWGIDNRKGKMLNLAFFSLNISALWAAIIGREIKFKVTPKTRKEELFLSIVAPQIAVVALTLGAIAYAAVNLLLQESSPELGTFIVNGFWGLLNAWSMSVLIFAAFWRPETTASKEIDVKNRLIVKAIT